MAIDTRVRLWTIWAMPFVLIGLALAWETDFGHSLTPVPALNTAIAAQPVGIALMPEYVIEGGIESRRQTIDRTLFNPTRRPAPPQQAAAAEPSFPRGQFVLTGTMVANDKATALLREVKGGRSRRVQQGETINGATVAEVRADRVKLTLGTDSEELTLKVASGPRVTIQPAPAVAPVRAPGAPGAPGAAAPPPAQQSGQVPQQQPQLPQPPQNAAASQSQTAQTPQAPGVADVADVLGIRRRARAADGAGAQRQ